MSMYYDDLTENEMWSSFSTLVDVSEREHHLRFAKKINFKFQSTTVSKEEKVNCSFLDHVPRKRRSSSLMNYLTRRNPQIPLRNLQNPRSYGSLMPPILTTEKTENENPPSYNSHSSPTSCLTENRSRKRPAIEQRKSSVGFKKAKVSPLKVVETPVWLHHVMSEMKGGATDPKLIFEKALYATDVDPAQSRLSLPFNKLIRSNFLTPQESRIIEEDIKKNEKTGVGAIMVDQRCEKWGVMLKRWEMKKESGKGSYNYALNCGWNEIVEANGLRARDRISVWSLRWRGVLCFALVPSSPSGHNNASLSL